jgi:hypothetical protein
MCYTKIHIRLRCKTTRLWSINVTLNWISHDYVFQLFITTWTSGCLWM